MDQIKEITTVIFRIQTIQARDHGKIHIILLQGAIKEEEQRRSPPEVAQVEAVMATGQTESVVLEPTRDMEV